MCNGRPSWHSSCCPRIYHRFEGEHCSRRSLTRVAFGGHRRKEGSEDESHLSLGFLPPMRFFEAERRGAPKDDASMSDDPEEEPEPLRPMTTAARSARAAMRRETGGRAITKACLWSAKYSRTQNPKNKVKKLHCKKPQQPPPKHKERMRKVNKPHAGCPEVLKLRNFIFTYT